MCGSPTVLPDGASLTGQAQARHCRLLGRASKAGGHPTVLENYRIPEDNAYLGQLLCVGQIVHGDGQEHVQQRV